jgi:hypothetical protein
MTGRSVSVTFHRTVFDAAPFLLVVKPDAETALRQAANDIEAVLERN